MKVIIAEKPDQGRKLAAPYPHSKKEGYLEIKPNDTFPEGALLTWAVGHLCELVPPESYDDKWKKWSLDHLPIVPDRFQHQVSKGKWKQFNIIKQLVQRQDVTEIIIAGDAEREGEAIIRIILSKIKPQKRMKRLWISSLTPRAVKNGFNNLLDESETRNIYYEALSRACADWLIGMNASRAYTLLLQKKGISDVFSIGRVQTPTLALIVQRESEIANFISEPFWEVTADFKINDKMYTGKWHKEGDSRLKDLETAEKVSQFCQNKEAAVNEVEKERKEFLPPFLFNLSSLQATANKMYKFSPKKTLDTAQKLYVKGIISYPRSDSSFVTKEEASLFPETLEKISRLDEYKKFFPLQVSSIENNKRFVNEKKVSDHYAIIPTEQVADPSRLSGDEQKIYDIIVRRLIAAHYNKAVFDYTTVHTLVDGRATFFSKGKAEVEEGWRKVIFGNIKEKETEEDQILPPVEDGEKGHVLKTKVKESKTQPPKRYTEGQLITLMKTAGKYLDDQELVKILKSTEGLGTEATRAGIIGTLKTRKYIEVKKNQVYATDKGKLLIEAIGENILASPEMTAKWEQRLHEIGEGEASSKAFMEQAKKLSAKIIVDAVDQSNGWNFQDIDTEQFKGKSRGKRRSTGTVVGKCIKCSGNIIDKGNFFGCSNYASTKCDFTISKKVLGKTVSQANVKKLLKDGKTNIIKGFKKENKTFDASLELDKSTYRLKFHY
ncbi:DNA topoisomerase III [Pseudalkalibacillus caeni]|uniref:DNA topoisomerase n=1 Tax=Exobacillus caeni TaxID=2574798 RepID=A0A5R9F7I6_9BACL|nr:DNA topoisomerase III [Pseudalkalibacillus caeni]TLS37588.1 DNA topoisomerase III [Pseudalkalibacillus caeni]